MKKILWILYSFVVIMINFRLKEKNYNFILLAIFFILLLIQNGVLKTGYQNRATFYQDNYFNEEDKNDEIKLMTIKNFIFLSLPLCFNIIFNYLTY
ncbi:TPA: hypothetical protein ACKOQA_002040 [Clostridioides difficile]|uniref:hypothetical protein n=1 Tax=Clostridioides difficile TaxID=1496 RepID=UPI00093B35C4|nr:hypothetical protein [Clostridioides difficile]MBN5981697.1 hypothetical protein [Clostridioides difficile]UWI48500.1 hypothetical protein NZ312_10275 [Clostridioides difficile]HBF0144824.1 hypothetical protein [Clostridioides difficile]HBF0148627.1 hypothetical protein [Clostridioides difficile]HBF9318830.1 hypothetical protein [Clostridioides difficile]